MAAQIKKFQVGASLVRLEEVEVAELIEDPELLSSDQKQQLQPSNSQWASPLIMAHKKDVTHRFCVDYHHLKLVTKADTCPLPLWTINWINWGKLVTFSTLVFASGYKRASGFPGEDSVCEF